MNLAPVLQVVSRRMGVDPSSLGSSAVRAAIEARLAASGPGGAAAYAARLDADPDALARLAEDIIVPETWFFRGGDLFAHLVRAAATAPKHQPWRALSLPCSSGEEPYSLAIACAEAGLPESRVRLFGVDISERAVEQAQLGLFGSLSFRQMDEPTRRAWFRPTGEAWSLVPEIRRRVAFQAGNILDPALLRHEPPFDAVLCRNLFIYLTPEARGRALAALARLVRPGGLLGVGHAEPLPVEEKRFTRDGPPPLFLYRRVEATPARPMAEPPLPVVPTGDHLELARREADAGRLDAALAACREAEARVGPTAVSQALLGVLHQARHEPALAIRHFRRALNLDPRHREALTSLLILSRQAGDLAETAALARRLRDLGEEQP